MARCDSFLEGLHHHTGGCLFFWDGRLGQGLVEDLSTDPSQLFCTDFQHMSRAAVWSGCLPTGPPWSSKAIDWDRVLVFPL